MMRCLRALLSVAVLIGTVASSANATLVENWDSGAHNWLMWSWVTQGATWRATEGTGGSGCLVSPTVQSLGVYQGAKWPFYLSHPVEQSVNFLVDQYVTVHFEADPTFFQGDPEVHFYVAGNNTTWYHNDPLAVANGSWGPGTTIRCDQASFTKLSGSSTNLEGALTSQNSGEWGFIIIGGSPSGSLRMDDLNANSQGPSSVPEPASCALLALAVGGIGAMVRRRRRA